jgi:hypothetical protein
MMADSQNPEFLRYIVYLSDQSDRFVYIVEKPIWDWINSEAKAKDKKSWLEQIPGSDEFIPVTIGSFENDRALRYMGHAKIYYSLSEAVKAIVDNGHVLVDTYEGYCY